MLLPGPGSMMFHQVLALTKFLWTLGGSYNQFKVFFKKFGIEFRFVPGDNLADFEAAIDKNTKGICESHPTESLP